MLESIKTLEIKSYMLFNLDFASNTVLSCFFLFFLFVGLCFFISVVLTQIFNAIGELVIPTGIPTKKVKAEIETHPVIVKIYIYK